MATSGFMVRLVLQLDGDHIDLLRKALGFINLKIV
jgi:hypothetical protein